MAARGGRPEVAAETVASWAQAAAAAADEKKGVDTVIIEVGAVLAITDYFVITSAPNARLVRTIADSVEDELKRDGGPSPLRIEGLSDASWVLMDYGDLVVHVFAEETRRFYDLERLWKDMPRLDWTPTSSAPGADTDES
jgi:ribosome-associated protein